MGERGEAGGRAARGKSKSSLPISFFPWPRDSFLAPSEVPFHDRAPRIAQKPCFSDFWRRKRLFCSLRRLECLCHKKEQIHMYLQSVAKLILFADDTNLFFSHKDPVYLIELLNQEILKFSQWLITNRLSLNLDKTKFILFKPRQKKRFL